MKIIDLLNKIAKGELPNKTKFKVYSSCNAEDNRAFICEYDEDYPGIIWCICDDGSKFNYKIDYMRILNYEVELIEEEQDIDIQNIKEYNDYELSYMCPEELKPMANMCNKLIKAVKQLDKIIKESDNK